MSKAALAVATPCACGCGRLAKPGNRFLNGHTGRPKAKPKTPSQPCACGCGATTRPGTKFVGAHHLTTAGRQARRKASFRDNRYLSADVKAKLEAALDGPTTVRCAHCPSWSVEVRYRDARAAFAEHCASDAHRAAISP